jgi:SAM-dependent methyltransferase
MPMDDDLVRFYNETYHRDSRPDTSIPRYWRRLAARVGVTPGERVLDVACGSGRWLASLREQGVALHGVDISSVAIDVCRQRLPEGEFHVGQAESLPFEDDQFDFVSCLGALEHFLDPAEALREMRRVARDSARLLLLVPNADFLTRRLGLFRGTRQALVREEVRTIEAWKALCAEAGFTVEASWKDLHVLCWDWIARGRWYAWPARALQAVLLPLWPLRWQYQVFLLCR